MFHSSKPEKNKLNALVVSTDFNHSAIKCNAGASRQIVPCKSMDVNCQTSGILNKTCHVAPKQTLEPIEVYSSESCLLPA